MGGSSKAPTSTTQTSIPEYARPYVEGMLASTQKMLYNVDDKNQITGMKPMEQYSGLGASDNRVAQFTPMQQQAAGRMQVAGANLGGVGEMVPKYDAARGATEEFGYRAANQNYQGSNVNAGYTPSQFSANYNPSEFRQGSFTQPGTASQYMDPYQQNVVDINKREATRQAAIQNTNQQAQATQAGAFGGGRDALMRAENQRNLNQHMNDIQNTGNQAAFMNAQGQYNTEAGLNFQAQQARDQSRQYGAGLDFQAQHARDQSKQFGTQAGLQAAGINEQSRQFGANLGLQGLQTGLQAAGQYGQLTQNEAAQRLQAGNQEHMQNMDITNGLANFGSQERAANQQKIDNEFQDFQNRQNFGYQNLAFSSDMLRGQPLANTSIYNAPPSALSQMAGLGTAGIAGLGLYNSTR